MQLTSTNPRFFAHYQRFDLGTQCKIGAECGLARGNPQWPGVLGLFIKSEIVGIKMHIHSLNDFTKRQQIKNPGSALQNFLRKILK